MYKPTFRMSKTRVPLLRKDDIDTLGECLVADFCPQALSRPMEIDIDRFVTSYLGLEQDFQYLSHCGVYLGMTVFNDTDKVPVYNPRLNRAEYVSARAGTVIIDNSLLEKKQEHRYRFTVGHEGSHSILHTGYFGCSSNRESISEPDYVPIIQCRMNNPEGNKKPVSLWTDVDRMEWQADRLSSAILMPKSMVLKMVAALSSRAYAWLPGLYVYEMSHEFNVSCSAAEYRLKDLGVIPGETTIPYAKFGYIDI